MDILKKLKNKSFFLKSISVIISIVIILSVFAVSMIASADNPEIWDGTKASSYAGGEGTKEKPYLIENGAQLYKMVAENATSTNGAASTEAYKYYKITKDIHLNDVKDQDLTNPSTSSWDAKGFKPWLSDTTQSSGFCGQVDGGGFTVYGLYCKSGTYSGLITSTVGAKVFDLNVKNAFVKGNGGAGGIIGQAYGADAEVSVSKCTVDNVYIDGGAKVRIGGIVGGCEGSAKKVEISDCSVTRAKLVTTHGSYPNIQSGLLGYTGEQSKNHKVTNCFTDGTVHPVTDTANTTHFKKFTNYITYTNVYTSKTNTNAATGVTVLTDDKMKGENAKTNLQGFDFDNVWEVKENAYPVLKAPSNIEVWDGTWVTDFSSFEGAGTEESPYLIENGAQLAFAVAKSGEALAKAKHYKLVKDIILNDTSKDGWEASAHSWVQNTSHRFNGELDGDGHTIEGLYWNKSSGGRYGLFAYTGKLASGDTHVATIKNITFKGASVSNSAAASDATQGAAIVAGQASGETVFENIIIDETSTINAPKIKGVAGLVARGYNNNTKAHITIINCAVNASITGGSAVGAFTGTHWDTAVKISINNSYSSSNVALVGGNSGTTTITNSYGLVADSYGTNVLASADLMKGDAAKTNMSGLDFEGVWKTVENGYPVIEIREVIPKDVWDGTKAASLTEFKGEGTKDVPYEIENASQLAYVVSTDLENGLYFKLVKDIKINHTAKANWKNSARNWVQNTSIRAVLNLDGDGHTIDGLYFNTSSARLGLFAYIGDSVIENIKFTNASINHTSNGEGIAIVTGQTSATSTFNAIYIDETCEINAPSGVGVAAISGRGYSNENAGAIVTNSAVLAKITGSSAVGAFIGTYWYSSAVITVNGCFSNTGLPIRGNNYGTTNAESNYGIAADNYNTNVLSSTDLMKGDAAKENMPGLDFYCIWETVENDYPVFRKDILDAWGGAPVDTSVIAYAGGDGTKANPYKIENADQLYKMVAENSNQDVFTAAETKTYFEITSDINLGNKQWYSVSGTAYPNSTNYTTGFAGVIYGNGYTIYNLYNNKAVGVAGLIPVATQGTEIYDLHLVGGTLPKVAWNNYVAGGLIGLAVATKNSKPIVISGCSVEDYIVSSRDASSAFVGMSYSQSLIISDCYALNNDVTQTATTGGWENSAAFVAVHGDGNGEGNSIIIENSYCDTAAKIGYVKNMSTTFNNVYTTLETYDNSIDGLTKVTAALITGDTAKETLNGFNFNQIWQAVDGAYPVHISFEKKSKLWDGTVAEGFAGGEGTLESPYLISNASQLYLLANADTSATKGKYYKLTNDISISDVYENWELDNSYSWTKKTAYLDGYTYGNSFAGILDGAGYTVSGLFVTDTVSNGGTYTYGLIPFVSANAVIRNINVNDTYISVDGESYAGAVAGVAHVTEDDASNPLKQVYFVDVNVKNCDITAKYSSDILGGAKRGVKFNRCDGATLESNDENNILNLECNKELSVDNDALVYNSVNGDASLFTTARRVLLGISNQKIVDINCVEGFDIADLVAINEAITANSPEESLVWSQEFNGDSLDYSVWSRNTTMSKGTTIEYADNNTVNGGTLNLYCEDTGNTDANSNNIYSVNYGLSTIDTMSFKYGRLEMRAKIPFYSGAFPSLWLSSRSAIGYEKQSTYSTEIDIFEVFGNGEYDLGQGTSNNYQMVACVHKWYNDENGNKTGVDCSCGTSSGAGNNYIVGESNRSKTFNSSAQREAWHDIVFEWTEDSMVFSVDGEVYYTANREDMEGYFGVTGEDYTVDGLFEQFLCIRLNNHMYTKGGFYEFTGSGSIDASKLNYEIDYIRLYQKNDGKSQINLK